MKRCAKQAALDIERGRELRRQGRLAEALVLFENALRCAPDLPRAHAGHAATLVLLGRLREGIAGYQQAIRLQPDYTRAWNNLAGAYLKAGEAGLAVETYRRAALNPDFDLHSNLLYSLNFHSGWTPAQAFASQAEWGLRFGSKGSSRHRNLRSAQRRLRIRYMSGY